MRALSDNKPPGARFVTLWQELKGPYGRLLQFLLPYKVRFAAGLVCGALFGCTNGMLPVVIQQVSSIVFNGEVRGNRFAACLTPGGVVPRWLVVAACAAIPTVMILRGIFSYFNGYCAEWVSQRVLMDLRSRLLEATLAQPIAFFSRTRAGELIARITNTTIEAQQALTRLTTDLIAQPFSLATGLLVLFRIDWQFMLATLVLFPLCLLPARYLGRRIRAAAHAEEMRRGEIFTILNEVIAGIRVVKSFARAGHEVRRFEKAARAQFNFGMRLRRALDLLGPLVEGIAAIGVGLAFYYVHLRGMHGADFVALCAGIFLLYQPIKTLSRLHLLLQRSLAATRSIFELLDRQPEVRDAPGARRLHHCRGEIVFERVSFSYRPGAPALCDVSLRFEPGRHYALVGASGAGKKRSFR